MHAMRSILITGGAGFVGSSLALRFQAAAPGAVVTCLDNFYRQGSELNAARLTAAGVRVVRGDVRDARAFEALPACDLVVDAAAEPSVLAGRSGDVEYLVDSNLVGTLHALNAARKWSAAFLFLSTSRVYPVESLRAIRLVERETRFELAAEQVLPGLSADGIAEEFPLAGPRTLYGATKYAGEVMVQEFAAQLGVRALVDRCGVLAGPWQMGKVDQGVVALWVARHAFGLPLRYIGYGGKQVRDALHVEDLADLVLRQLAQPERWNGDVYCVGGGREVSFSLRELTELARAATGATVPVGQDDHVRPGDVPLYLTDARRVREAFGWQPRRSMAQIVEDTARWVRENREAVKSVFGG
jgi:CDP-paratose 2-epimerase